jgi:hypothetical protein
MKAKQASRSKPIPAQLGKLIDLANIVPPECELPDSFIPMEDVPLPGFGLGRADQYFINLIETKFPKEQFPAFRQYLGPLYGERISSAHSKYQQLRAARQTLRAIIVAGKDNFRYKEIRLKNIHDALVELPIDEQGRIQVSPSPIVKALEGVEAFRIRLCPVCGKIFWAGRLDQPCCTPVCAHVLRTRRWRENYQEKYKQQRINRALREEVEVKYSGMSHKGFLVK